MVLMELLVPQALLVLLVQTEHQDLVEQTDKRVHQVVLDLQDLLEQTEHQDLLVLQVPQDCQD
jgi:hypothetical protein